MEYGDQADTARRVGNTELAIRLYSQALEHERRAAIAVAAELTAEPTRSVLHRSAVSLAIDCGELREAERLICTALAGNPPEEIAEELRDLLESIYTQRDNLSGQHILLR